MSDLIPLAKIRRNPANPRSRFDPAQTKALADSILAAGKLHQAIGVRRVKDDGNGTEFEIIWGGRRFEAFNLLAAKDDKWARIPAVVKRMNEDDRDIAALVENLQRVDLTEMEEARHYQRMRDKGYTVKQLATACGVPAFRVKWRLSLLKLEPEIQKLVEIGAVPPGHALELAKVEPAEQGKLIRRFAAGKLAGIDAMRAAVAAVLGKDAQAEMDTGAPADPKDVAVVTHMEARIARFAELSQTGWKDGECQIASKVDPDRAILMADQLKAIGASLKEMERQLRKAHARRETIASQQELPEQDAQPVALAA